MEIYNKLLPSDEHLRQRKLKTFQISDSSFYYSCRSWIYFITSNSRMNGNNSVIFISSPLKLSCSRILFVLGKDLEGCKYSEHAKVIHSYRFDLATSYRYRPFWRILTTSLRIRHKYDRAQNILHNQCAIPNNSKKMENHSSKKGRWTL